MPLVVVEEQALHTLLSYVIELSRRPEVGLRGEARDVLQKWDNLRGNTPRNE